MVFIETSWWVILHLFTKTMAKTRVKQNKLNIIFQILSKVYIFISLKIQRRAAHRYCVKKLIFVVLVYNIQLIILKNNIKLFFN